MTEQEKQKIVSVLTQLVEAILAANRELPVDTGPGISIPPGVTHLLDARLRSWERDPIGRGLRQGVKAVGEIAAKFATDKELLEIHAMTCKASTNSDVAGGILSHAWDGVVSADGLTWRA